jgi:serine/threonine protein kinase
MNGDLTRRIRIHFNEHLTLQDLLTQSIEQFEVRHAARCRLYDGSGGEVTEDDVEYLNTSEPLFLSQGEDFAKNSSLAVYEEIKALGEGGYGTVKLCRHIISNKEFAVKFVSIKSLESPEDVNRVYYEIQLLRDLHHPSIVQLHDAFPVEDKICFVMEYCRGGELAQHLEAQGSLGEDEVFSISCQMIDAIRYCHNSKAIHRDLKLENVLFADAMKMRIKIVDFGIAGMFTAGRTGERSDAGSVLFTAPEVISGQDNSSRPSLDVWSMGCMIYCMLTGNHPFQGESMHETIANILAGRRAPLPPTVSSSWSKLIHGMLRLKPRHRWSVIRAYEHVFKYRDCPDREVSDLSESSEDEAPKLAAKHLSSATLAKPPKKKGARASLRPSDGRLEE